MKLQEFFDNQKQINFSDVEKLDLYHNFLYKKTRKQPKRISFIQAKYLVYSIVFILMIFGIYGIYFFNNKNLQDNGRFSIVNNGINTAQADYIAQIIEARGNFYIEHNGILTKTNTISNGDTLLLKEDARLVFEIASGGTQSQIIGPAKLIIQKTNNEEYKLNLIYGDFIYMKGNEQKQQKIELAIKDITLKQQDNSQPIDFKFVQEGKNRILQNNGANIIVTKSNGKEKTTIIGKQQIIAIQEHDMKIFSSIESFTKAIQEKNVSQTFTLTTMSKEENNKQLSNTGDDIMTLLSLLSTTNNSIIKEEVTKNITSTLNNKKILDPTQDEKIHTILQKTEYINEIKGLEEAFVNGNKTTFETFYNKLEKRIQNLYQTLGLPYTKIEGNQNILLKELEKKIQVIKEFLNKEYNIPPEYIQHLQAIETSLHTIITKGGENNENKVIEETTQ